jgi:hypothetical protein
VFNYAKGMHTVVEVSAGEYMACTAANPLGSESDSSGATTVALKAPGTHYYVCSITGHCGAGMKLAVTVGVGGSNSNPPGATPDDPTTPRTSPTPTAPYTMPTTTTAPYTTPTTTPTTTTPYTTPTTTPTTTTPYTTPTCSGGGGATATPGMTPFMSYPSPSAAGLGSAALAGFGLVWCVIIVQLALL